MVSPDRRQVTSVAQELRSAVLGGFQFAANVPVANVDVAPKGDHIVVQLSREPTEQERGKFPAAYEHVAVEFTIGCPA